MRRQIVIVAVAVALVAFVSYATAGSITYNLVDYPGSQSDTIVGGIDTISGTITTNGALGIWPFGSMPILDASVKFCTTSGTYSAELLGVGGDGSPFLYATPTQLLLPDGYQMGFVFGGQGTVVQLIYSRDTQAGVYDWGFVGPRPVGGANYAEFFDATSVAPTAAWIGYNDPWVIARVAPEPGTLTLLGSALLGLAGIVYLRRRRAKACVSFSNFAATYRPLHGRCVMFRDVRRVQIVSVLFFNSRATSRPQLLGRCVMKRVIAITMGVAVVLCYGTTMPAFGISYFNDFEAYSVPSAINGNDGWTSASSSIRDGVYGWRVNTADQAGMQGAITYGKFLERNQPFSAEGTDFATLHLTSSIPVANLHISFNYILEGNESGRVEISGNSSDWIDVTSELGITARYTDDMTNIAAADLSSDLESAGITTDMYVRFNAWNPTGNPEWHDFAIDNLSITAAPEPSTLILLAAGAISLLGYAWRRRHRAA